MCIRQPRFASVCFALWLTGCSGLWARPEPSGAPPASGPLTLALARDVVAAFEADLARRKRVEPRIVPRSLDDVLEILRSDQIDQFAAGVEFAARGAGARATALQAQIELAWGDAQLLLAEVLWRLAANINSSAGRVAARVASGDRSDAALEELSSLRREGRRYAGVAEALPFLAAEHIHRGAELARTIIAEHPENYLGYRVAADYYHLKDDWHGFEKMVAGIREHNPDSIGLIFLRGVESARRNDDMAAAATHFRAALERDPKFTRARAQLVLVQESLSATLAEFAVLQEMQPDHQLVIWARELVDELHALKQRRYRL